MKIQLLLLLLALSGSAQSQSVAPVLLGSANGNGILPNASIYWATGELTIATMIAPSNQITQGFWQPEYLPFTSANEPLQTEYGIACRPNPVVDALQITIALPKSVQLALYALDGRLLLREKTIDDGQVLSLAYLPTSTYLLRFDTEDGRWIMTQKIVKQ